MSECNVVNVELPSYKNVNLFTYNTLQGENVLSKKTAPPCQFYGQESSKGESITTVREVNYQLLPVMLLK